MATSEFNSKEKAIFNALKTVIDPELGVSIVDLGLIYDISVDNNGKCQINWTLTTMGCPIIDVLTGLIYEAAMSVDGIKECETKLVYYPQWTPEKMSREARMTLGVHL
ncbi:metal-sulfur cluster assembly factor [Lactobacillus helveticus]|uniref:metal-sulfur cluster assembly factor n=1 Tax=Lactobacillus TaxID=1578 RepID=UPI0015627A00|nr:MULTISPECIES: metal-sulfur cluster assembly factor [Lactobacillus]MBN6048817.1 metal-sulfur cluster assembly factor [Lactobacillus helveticus]MCO0808195.1 metal-sulfur cluster assembly factor [Lactobacillus helveticus]MCP9317678.1 metal-sulfur cluster assembly factor [Lactobacillus helveticus]MDH5818418.1 metal-sulfur cluster assembly factor [Lactobacillus helveticus]MDN5584483.1 metal-sulfur cluster assembly factor [Lactobacillus sp.]